MQVTKTVQETRALIKNWKKEGKTIGLVPTMGFLHEGHASLIKRCREENDIVVVSDTVWTDRRSGSISKRFQT